MNSQECERMADDAVGGGDLSRGQNRLSDMNHMMQGTKGEEDDKAFYFFKDILTRQPRRVYCKIM